MKTLRVIAIILNILFIVWFATSLVLFILDEGMVFIYVFATIFVIAGFVIILITLLNSRIKEKEQKEKSL